MTLTLWQTPYAKAEATTLPHKETAYLPPIENAANPSGFTCYSPEEIRALANYKKGCDVCKLNLKDTKNTLQKCIDHGAPATQWWADPKLVVGGFVISIGVGALIGATLLK